MQDDSFEATDSTTICAFATDPTKARLFRVQIEPSEANELDAVSRIMVESDHGAEVAPGTRVGGLQTLPIPRDWGPP